MSAKINQDLAALGSILVPDVPVCDAKDELAEATGSVSLSDS